MKTLISLGMALAFGLIAFVPACTTTTATFKGNLKITSLQMNVDGSVTVTGTARVKSDALTNTVEKADSIFNAAKNVIQFSKPTLDTLSWWNSDFILTTPKLNK